MIPSRLLVLQSRIHLSCVANYSIKTAISGKGYVERIALTANKKMFVAVHPNSEVPYEMSRPLPLSKNSDSGSLLKQSSLDSAMSAFKSKSAAVAVQELAQMTHTTRHRWYPRSRDKRAKNTPMDRKYL